MHRLYCSAVQKTQAFNPQMYPWNSGAQEITTDVPSSILIEKVEMD